MDSEWANSAREEVDKWRRHDDQWHGGETVGGGHQRRERHCTAEARVPCGHHERSRGSWDAVEGDGFGRESANASPDSQFGSRERGEVLSFSDWSWETNPDVVEMALCRYGLLAPTLPIPSQSAERSGEVGQCVEHPGHARGADPRCSCAANGRAGEGDCW